MIRSELAKMDETRKFLIIIPIFLVLSYSPYLLLNEDTINLIGDEDGVFEYLTAIFFFAASLFFLRTFLMSRNVFFLLLTLVFFLGFGEEISWGQRIFGIGTPQYFEENNVQGEITLHNLEIFNAKDFDNNLKGGLAKLLTINFLYNLFWLSFGILLPLSVMFIPFVRRLAGKIRLPVPALSIGLTFLVNWLIFRVTKSFFLPEGRSLQYYDTIGEIQECGSSFIFLMIGIYFFQKVKGETKTA